MNLKQGRASSNNFGGRKVEPVVHAINPGGVGQIGIAQGNHATDKTTDYRGESCDAGRGFMAPGINSSTSNKGSQGRH